MNYKKIIIILAVVVFVGAAVFAFIHHKNNCIECFSISSLNADVVRHFIQGFGNWAFLIFILLYTANTFSPFFPPIIFMSLAAGLLFGPLGGTIALTLGTFSGTSAAFFTARYVGRSSIEKLIAGKGADINEKLSNNGFIILLPMRIIGFPPYGIIDFICGLSRMKYSEFVAATMIGAAPWIITQVLLADRFANFDPKDPVMWGLLVFFILMIVVTSKIVKSKQEKESGEVNG